FDTSYGVAVLSVCERCDTFPQDLGLPSEPRGNGATRVPTPTENHPPCTLKFCGDHRPSDPSSSNRIFSGPELGETQVNVALRSSAYGEPESPGFGECRHRNPTARHLAERRAAHCCSTQEHYCIGRFDGHSEPSRRLFDPQVAFVDTHPGLVIEDVDSV